MRLLPAVAVQRADGDERKRRAQRFQRLDTTLVLWEGNNSEEDGKWLWRPLSPADSKAMRSEGRTLSLKQLFLQRVAIHFAVQSELERVIRDVQLICCRMSVW